MGLKSHPIPAPPSLRGGENPHGAKRGGAGQAGRGKIAIPTLEGTVRDIKAMDRRSHVVIDGDDPYAKGV